MDEIKSFKDFGLEESLVEGLDCMKISEATPIQKQAIPVILEGKDIIACAQTGTGKTAAFLVPVMNSIIKDKSEASPKALIIAPTRELALQIDRQVEGISYFTGISSMPVYGGSSAQHFDNEKKALTGGADIIIATPGKLLSHLKLGYCKTDNIKFLILDEADKMLDMGFSEDIKAIAKHVPLTRQSLLFSATMPPKIRKLASELLKFPEEISIAISKTAKGVTQEAFLVHDENKIELIKHIFLDKQYESSLIFCSTKRDVKDTTKALKRIGHSCEEFHSDLDQEERNETLRKFKNRKVSTLVATDILSRGIDIKGIELVINYNVPGDAEDYVHRVGRTARADETGRAITLINRTDQNRFKKIEELITLEIPKLNTPESIGDSPEYRPKQNFGQKGHSGGKGKPNWKKRKPNNRPKRN